MWFVTRITAGCPCRAKIVGAGNSPVGLNFGESMSFGSTGWGSTGGAPAGSVPELASRYARITVTTPGAHS